MRIQAKHDDDGPISLAVCVTIHLVSYMPLHRPIDFLATYSKSQVSEHTQNMQCFQRRPVGTPAQSLLKSFTINLYHFNFPVVQNKAKFHILEDGLWCVIREAKIHFTAIFIYLIV
jgi:hypothetical protein